MSQEEEIRKARAKISKLLNMTVENGCTEDEQESAMRMAAGLATRLGIELDSVRATEPTAAQRKAVKKAVNQEFKVHQVLAAQAAAALYGCKLYTYDHGKGGLFFVGREENVEMAEQTMFWLMRQVELLYKQNLPRGLTQAVRAQYRKTFKAACAHRVAERAYALMEEMKRNDQAAQAATGKNALVVQDYFKTLEQEIADYFAPTAEQQAAADRRRLEREQWERDNPVAAAEAKKELEKWAKKQSKRKGPRARRLPTGIGTNAGLAAGDRVQLRREVK